MDSTSVMSVFTNGMPFTFLIAYLLWAYVGVSVNAIVDIYKRNPKSNDSPVPFTFGYWWRNNKERLIVALILSPVGVILFNFLASQYWPSITINILYAFAIGIMADRGSEAIKSFKKRMNNSKLLK